MQPKNKLMNPLIDIPGRIEETGGLCNATQHGEYVPYSPVRENFC